MYGIGGFQVEGGCLVYRPMACTEMAVCSAEAAWMTANDKATYRLLVIVIIF